MIAALAQRILLNFQKNEKNGTLEYMIVASKPQRHFGATNLNAFMFSFIGFERYEFRNRDIFCNV